MPREWKRKIGKDWKSRMGGDKTKGDRRLTEYEEDNQINGRRPQQENHK